MDELIGMVTEKAGISTDQAGTAIETVMGFLKDKLPAPIAAQLDGVISGEGGGLSADPKDLLGSVGGMLGK